MTTTTEFQEITRLVSERDQALRSAEAWRTHAENLATLLASSGFTAPTPVAPTAPKPARVVGSTAFL